MLGDGLLGGFSFATPGTPPIFMEFLFFERLIHIVFKCGLPALLALGVSNRLSGI
jgi:hypothetical protein